MTKRLILFVSAAIALGLATPPTGRAAEATCPAGSRCPLAHEIALTGKNVVLDSSTVGGIGCSTLNLKAEITRNDGTFVGVQGSTLNPTQTGCNNGSGRPVTVTNFDITYLSLSGTATFGTKPGTLAFTSEIELPKGVVCSFTGTNVPVQYAYKSNVLKASNASGITSAGGCGTAKLSGEFALELYGTTAPVILD